MAQRVNMQAHPSQLELGKVDSHVLLELFPFALILDHDMCIQSAGEKVIETWILQNPSKPPQSFWGSRLIDIFKLRRPKGITFDWDTVIQMNMVIFELELNRSENEEDMDPKVSGTQAENQKSMNEKEMLKKNFSSAVEAAQTGNAINDYCERISFILYLSL